MKHLIYFLLIVSVLNLTCCQGQKDQSKTLEEYYDLGFPKINHKWNDSDMEAALTALESLKQENQFALPKINSDNSSVYFNKILQELPRVDLKETQKINAQFEKFSRFEKIASRLAFAYGPQEELQIYYSNEAIEIHKLSLEEMVKVGKLFQILISNMPDSIRIKNKANEELFEGGVVKVFEASLEMQLPYNKYAPEDKIELAKVISSNLPIAWPWLKHDSKSSIMQLLVGLSKESEISEVRKIYSTLKIQLKNWE